jgi:putative oligomerization/nucleic acid binding protein
MSAGIDTPQPAVRAPGPGRGRSVGVWVVLVVAGFFLLLSTFAVWVDRVALNTNVFVDTSTELIEDKAIRKAVATRAVDELFDSVDVQAEMKQQLPKDFKSLSGPATAGLREASYRVVDRALEQPALQRLWALSLEQSHRTLVQVLEGQGSRASTDEGTVTLDLEQIVLEAAGRVGIRDQVEDNLPADVGRIEILRSDELDTAQNAFQLLRTLAWVLPILTLVAFALALLLARDRRRAVRGIGITTAVVGVLGLVAANLTGDYLVSSLVADTQSRAAAGNAWDIVTELMRASFRWLVVTGMLFIVAAWLAGAGRRATAVRRSLAPAVRDRAWAYAGLTVVAVILLVTSPVSDFNRFLVIVVLVALGAAWIELMRRQTRREFPDASGAALLEDAQTRISGWWEAMRTPSEVKQSRAAPAADIAARLASLADLHTRGELTDEEYAAAKARVLADD